MKSTLPLILAVIVLTGIAVGVEAPYDLEAQACRLVDLLAKGDYDTAVKDFDPTMTLATPPGKLEEAWKSLQNAVGAFQKRQETHLTRIQQYNVVFVTCKFDKALVDVKVVFDSDRKIAGLFFVPPESAGADYQMPSYARPDATREQGVTVVSGRWLLPGTLVLPSSGAGPFPVAILVHGSGPHDRDETVGANRPFRDLALGLAAKGIATLRYEKRTRQYPDSFAARTDQVTVRDETINDALAAAAMLRGRGDIDSKRIFIIGHSLGGMVAPRIAKDDPNIAGLVIMSAPTRPIEDVILEQVKYLLSLEDIDQATRKDQIDKLKARIKVVKSKDLSLQTPSTSLPLGLPASYWLDLRNYKPAQAANEIPRPMLIIQGARDYQITTDDFDGWKKALSSHKDVKLILYPALNHLFIEGKGKSKPQEYNIPGHVAEVVINDIAGWINSIQPSAKAGTVDKEQPM